MKGLGRLDFGRLALLAVLAIGTVTLLTRDQWDWVFSSGEAQTQDVEAPTIDVDDVDEANERLYRVTPDNGSVARYEVEERLAGSSQTTRGASSVLAGDIVVNVEDPSLSRVGTIVVNVEMLESDSNLRDKRIRHDFLESTHWPFARFEPRLVDGYPASFADGATHELTIIGDLTVKETTLEVSFSGPVTVAENELTASMSATILGSEFGVGPIHIARLAHTEDQITLIFDLVADRVDLDSPGVGDSDLARDLAPDEVARGAFAEHVQPILESRCVACHTTDGPGWSTLAMETAADVAAIADDIALVTGAGYMPPWLPSDESLPFHNDWSLSDDELATLAGWAADGGGLDVSPDTPLVADTELIHPITRDLVILAREEYEGSLDQPDDYRCQVHEVDDADGKGTWVTGFAFEPDETTVVHHAITYRVPAAARGEVDAKDGSDGRPGWTCFGRSNLSAEGVYSIAGWAPGQQATIYPDGVGFYLEPGDLIVNQIHYHFDHDTPLDNSAIVLQTATEAEIAAGMTPIQGSSYITPAEIPCTPEEEGPLCDRSAVLAEIADKYGFEARFIPDFIIGQCGGSVDDYDDLDGTVGHSSCDLGVRNSGTVFSVLGHMHELGAAYRMTLNPGTADELVLLDIPVWSFEWQLNYRPVDDVHIDRSDTIRFECWWDRSLNFFEEPRYVTWNEGTVDEMCFSTVRVVPD